MSRQATLLTLLVAASVIWLWLERTPPAPPSNSGEFTPPPVAATAAIAATAHLPQTAEPERRDKRRDGEWWANELTADDEPVALEPDDANAVVLKGRLTVRQQPWVHPANVTIRLTRSWLDTVVPAATKSTERLPDRRDPIATTDEHGCFALAFEPTEGELFFLIDPRGPWQDFQRVDTVTRRSGRVDLGELFVDQRGSIVGRVVSSSGQPLAGVELRAVNDPLLDAAAGLEAVREARADGLEFFRSRGTAGGGATRSGALPDWVVRRDAYLPFPTAVSATDGSFRIENVRPGNHDVFAQPSPRLGGAKAGGILVGAGCLTDVGDVRAESSTWLYLTFRDERNAPHAGAHVAFVHRRSGFAPTRFVLDQRGDFRGDVASPPRKRRRPGPGGRRVVRERHRRRTPHRPMVRWQARSGASSAAPTPSATSHSANSLPASTTSCASTCRWAAACSFSAGARFV
jgi:hypothetical protein